MIKFLAEIFVFSAIFFILLYSAGVSASVYYVDYEGGEDGRSGLQESESWKHAPLDNKATSVARSTILRPGDVLQFRGGTVYRGALSIGSQINGEPGNPITLKGDGWGGKAVLDGSKALNASWSRCGSADECFGNPNWANIHYADIENITSFTRGLYQDGNFLWYSQDPNPEDRFYYDEITGYRRIPFNSSETYQNRTSITDPSYFVQQDPSYWDGAYVIVWRIPNVISTVKITGYDPAAQRIFHEDLGGDIYTDRDTYYSIINHLALIDSEGEYYYDEDSSILYLWPFGGAPGTISVIDSETGISITSAHDFIIEGFEIRSYIYGIRLLDWSNGVKPERITIRNNLVRNLKSNGAYAIQATAKDVLIENNNVEYCQRAVGILGGGTNLTVAGNNVTRTSRQGIWFMAANDSMILGNRVYDIKGSHSNCLSVYSGCNNILISSNVIWDCNSPITYSTSENLMFLNNIATGTGNSNVNDWGGCTGYVQFFNNVFVNNDRHYSMNVAGSPLANVTMVNNIIDGGGSGNRKNNIYTGLAWNQNPSNGWSLGEGEFVETDLLKIFINSSINNFRLREGSLAIDAGAEINAYSPRLLNNDIEGNPRPQGAGWDIGAYEFTGTQNNIPGDLNLDSIVNLADLQIIAASFGKNRGETGYSAASDLNNDKTINLFDVMAVVRNWRLTG